MRIDLREDQKAILAYIQNRVADFDLGANEGPGEGPTAPTHANIGHDMPLVKNSN